MEGFSSDEVVDNTEYCDTDLGIIVSTVDIEMVIHYHELSLR